MRTRSLLLGFLVFVGSQETWAKHFWRGTILELSGVEKRWGARPFSAELFKAADRPTRAGMAASILKTPQLFLGKSVNEVKESLGKPDGFYFRDSIPAYLIASGKEPWQIVFLYGEDRKIAEIFVHKNCCD